MRTQLEFITHGAEVQRYHTVTTLKTETVGHHSHGVALICLLLDPYCSRQLLTAALVHDLAEQYVGDIPSPAKRTLGFADKLDALEEEIINRDLGYLRAPLTSAEQRMLKLADIAQGALKCVRELQLGNSCMRVVFDRYMSYAASMRPEGREAELFNAIKEIAK